MNLHSKTLTVLKHIKEMRDEKGVMSIMDKIFSTYEPRRREALMWLNNFCNEDLPNMFKFDSEKQLWEYIGDDIVDEDFPIQGKE